jgi:hypothetical protein
LYLLQNGNWQDIKLLAWGQDVHLINGEIITTTTWNNDKPYLVYNSMLVDTNQTLRIDARNESLFSPGQQNVCCRYTANWWHI